MTWGEFKAEVDRQLARVAVSKPPDEVELSYIDTAESSASEVEVLINDYGEAMIS